MLASNRLGTPHVKGFHLTISYNWLPELYLRLQRQSPVIVLSQLLTNFNSVFTADFMKLAITHPAFVNAPSRCQISRSDEA